MTLLLNTSIKVTVIVLVALAAAEALRGRSAAVRHFVLAAALAFAAATPALRVIAPAWHAGVGTWLNESRVQLIDRPLAVLDSSDLASTPASGASSLEPSRAAAIARWLGITWIAGAAAGVVVLLAGLSRLAWLASRSRCVVDGAWARIADGLLQSRVMRRRPVLLQSTHPALLVTWGFLSPKVLLPSDAEGWPDDRIRIVLGHELAHVRRGDWLVQMSAELIRSVYWFNPLVWIACRRLRLESEQACDDAVLRMGVEGSAYATELVDLARAFKSQQEMLLPAAAIARPSSLERRVRAMLNVRLNREPITRSASIAAAILLAAVTVLVAGFGVSAQTFSTVSGTLFDPLERVLPGATVTLSNAQAQSKYEIKSDRSGRYEFVGVPPGTYGLVAEYPGFSTVKREGIVLTGQPFAQNVVMQVGSLQETITVMDVGLSAAPVVNEAPRPRVRPAFQAPECTATAVGGNIKPPTKTRDVRPVYPTGSSAGMVSLEARIGPDGLVTSVQPAADADAALANAASVAVSQWEFTPTYLDCQPIEVRMKVMVKFIPAK